MVRTILWYSLLAFLLWNASTAMPVVQGFVENAGQLPPQVRYYAPLNRGMLYITTHGYGYVLYGARSKNGRILGTTRVELRARTSTAAIVNATEQQLTQLNFYHGNQHFEGVRVFRRVVLDEIFPGVAAVLTYSSSGRIKCDYVVSAGADPSQVAVTVLGASGHISTAGQLHIPTPLGTIVESPPVSFQNNRVVRTRYVLDGTFLHFAFDDTISSNAPLTIDPEIEWSSYLGGSGTEQIAHVRTDAQQNIIVLGRTQSRDFPTRFGYSATLSGDYDAFIAKYSANGVLQWATYYGGSRREIHNLDHSDLVLDGRGNIIITGCTQSDDLPIHATAFQRSKASSMPSGYDVFLAEFSPSGQLSWSSYCGGNDNEDVFGLAADRLGNIYIIGHTSSDVFPLSRPATPNATRKPTTSQDVFVLKLSQQRQPLWVHFIGGNNIDVATDVVTDAGGNVYVCGYTLSINFPTFGSSVYQTIKTAGNDGYIFKLNGLGQLVWATLLGGNGEDYCTTLAIDSSFDRRLIVGGTTSSTDMWFRSNYGRSLGGSSDGFLGAFDPLTGAAQWVQYHGGSSFDELTAIAVDPDNHLIVAGRTLGEYPTKAAQQPIYRGGGGDMFVAKLTPQGETQWATYVGGSFLDRSSDIAINSNTNFVVVGQSTSADFPIVGNAQQPQLANSPGYDDGVLVTFCNITIPIAVVTGVPQFCHGETRTLIATSGNTNLQYDSYQWEADGTPIAGATEPSFTIPTTLEPGMYRFVCRVTNSVRCPAVTDTIVVQITPRPVIGERQFVMCSGDPITLDSVVIIGTEPLQFLWMGQPPPDNPSARAPLVHPTETTNYTLRVTDANGCTAERTFTVLVLPISQLPITVTGAQSFCEGDSVALSIPDGIGSIQWNTGETSSRIIVRTSGLYYATVRLPSGCEGSTNTVDIHVIPTPSPKVTFDGNVLSTVGVYNSYQWFLDGQLLSGATTRTLTPPRVGTYHVIVDSLGCTGISAPLNIALGAHTNVAIGSVTALIGEQISLPVTVGTNRPLDQVGVQKLTLQIRYNATILRLLPSHSEHVTIRSLQLQPDRTAIATIECTAIDRDTIAFLNFLAVWGNAERTPVEIVSLSWDSPAVTSTQHNGSVVIIGQCKVGATRLFDDTGNAFEIVSTLVSANALSVTVSAIEDCPHSLVLITSDGRQWTLWKDYLRSGTYVITADVATVAQGYYLLVFRSATLVTQIPIVIVR
ncbi:MAG: SBBP repeat-containing protein [Chlorobi bacterium]|nr:SBBP repeat-containing protein [Chlorobiota bacterium]